MPKSLSPEEAMEIEKLVTSSPGERLEHGEREMGFTVIRPGEADWFPADAWHRGSIASVNGRRVRLVALLAERPGHGALLKLVISIMARGLEPVIVEPSERLAETLHKWGWRPRRIGKGFETQNIWHPRPKWTRPEDRDRDRGTKKDSI